MSHPKPKLFYLQHANSSLFMQRLNSAKEIIASANKVGSSIVSVSWGKDSSVLSHLVHDTLTNLEMLHLQSPHELPGWELVKDYNLSFTSSRLYINKEMDSLEDYIMWLKVVGLPHERSRSDQAKAVNFLKKDRGKDFIINNGYKVQFLGMRSQENPGTRGKLFNYRGHTYQSKDGITFCNPLHNWTAIDIWAYIFSNRIVYHKLYDYETHGLTRETLRNSGWLTTDGLARDGRLLWLKEHFREQYIWLVEQFPHLAGER